MSDFTLYAGGNTGYTGWTSDIQRSHAPALAWPTLIASHMTATTIETRVVDLSSLCRLLLLSCRIVVVGLLVVEIWAVCGLRGHGHIGM